MAALTELERAMVPASVQTAINLLPWSTSTEARDSIRRAAIVAVRDATRLALHQCVLIARKRSDVRDNGDGTVSANDALAIEGEILSLLESMPRIEP